MIKSMADLLESLMTQRKKGAKCRNVSTRYKSRYSKLYSRSNIL